MTDLAPAQTPGAPGTPRKAGKPRKPGFLPTIAVAVATFAVLFEFLAFQLSSGNDPALGASALQVASTARRQPPQPGR